MEALPADRLGLYEEYLRTRWYSAKHGTRRGSLCCSLGLLGLRWAEVERARQGDVDLPSQRLRVRTAKGGRPRVIELPAGLMGALEGWIHDWPGREGRLFCRKTGAAVCYQDIRRFTATSTAAVFQRRYSFHCFRHTAAARLYERTRDVLAVQRYLGHTSLRWTQAYLERISEGPVGGPIAFVERPTCALRVFDPEAGRGCSVGEVRSVSEPVATYETRPTWAEISGEQVAGEAGDVGALAADTREQNSDGLGCCVLENRVLIGPGRARCRTCGSTWGWDRGAAPENSHLLSRKRNDLEVLRDNLLRNATREARENRRSLEETKRREEEGERVARLQEEARANELERARARDVKPLTGQRSLF